MCPMARAAPVEFGIRNFRIEVANRDVADAPYAHAELPKFIDAHLHLLRIAGVRKIPDEEIAGADGFVCGLDYLAFVVAPK